MVTRAGSISDQLRGRTLSRTHSAIDRVVAPGVKISFTPSFFNSGMSGSGMIPPPKTTTSSIPCLRSRSITAGKSVMCAPDMIESPIASTSSCTAAATIISGVWCSPPGHRPGRTGELGEPRGRIVADGKCRRKVLTGGRTERFRHAVDIPVRVPLALLDDPSKPGHVLFVARARTRGEPQRVVRGEHQPASWPEHARRLAQGGDCIGVGSQEHGAVEAERG